MKSSPLEPWGNPEPGHRDTSSSSHELPMESRAEVEPGSGKHECLHSLSERPKLRYLVEDENNEGLLAEDAAGTVVPRADNFDNSVVTILPM